MVHRGGRGWQEGGGGKGGGHHDVGGRGGGDFLSPDWSLEKSVDVDFLLLLSNVCDWDEEKKLFWTDMELLVISAFFITDDDCDSDRNLCSHMFRRSDGFILSPPFSFDVVVLVTLVVVAW